MLKSWNTLFLRILLFSRDRIWSNLEVVTKIYFSSNLTEEILHFKFYLFIFCKKNYISLSLFFSLSYAYSQTHKHTIILHALHSFIPAICCNAVFLNGTRIARFIFWFEIKPSWNVLLSFVWMWSENFLKFLFSERQPADSGGWRHSGR